MSRQGINYWFVGYMILIEPGETVLNLLVAPLQHLKQLPLHPPEATLERLVAEEVHHKNRNKNFWRNNRTLYNHT